MFDHLRQPFFVCVGSTMDLCQQSEPNPPVARDLHDFLQKQKIPKYKKLPDVEVSFKARVRTI